MNPKGGHGVLGETSLVGKGLRRVGRESMWVDNIKINCIQVGNFEIIKKNFKSIDTHQKKCSFSGFILGVPKESTQCQLWGFEAHMNTYISFCALFLSHTCTACMYIYGHW